MTPKFCYYLRSPQKGRARTPIIISDSNKSEPQDPLLTLFKHSIYWMRLLLAYIQYEDMYNRDRTKLLPLCHRRAFASFSRLKTKIKDEFLRHHNAQLARRTETTDLLDMATDPYALWFAPVRAH